MLHRWFTGSAFAFLAGAGLSASAGETDQYLVWNLELVDSSTHMNEYINAGIESELEKRTAEGRNDCRCQELAEDLFRYFFKGIHSSRVRKWLFVSEDIDRYPGRSVTYNQYVKMSIYRNRTFPPWLPMSRTIRIGDVYLGVDKIGHFFGFGRRYFQRYMTAIKEGLTEQEAIERVVKWGVYMEMGLVGGLVDGIFSHADLEANFQGFMLAKDLCIGNAPFLAKEGPEWILTRPIDMREYVTPDFDESYNYSHFLGLRKKRVLPVLVHTYAGMKDNPIVKARFARYAESEASLSKQLIDSHFGEKRENPREAQAPALLFSEAH